MSSEPLRVAFLWHQHQPYYKEGNSYLLPWARLHATKDYYDMAAALGSFEKLRQTINVVPSLLVQLVDYVENGASDVVLDLSRRAAAELDDEEKIEVLRTFFLCNVERMVLPYERYRELYRRIDGVSRDDRPALEGARATFSEQDWRDLQVWYNLTWIGEYSRQEQPFASLLAKGRDFTEEEKHALIEASLAIVARVIPTYRTMMERGQVELSVTPFYHPILPILCDSHSATEALPGIALPSSRITWPEDARAQIERAVALFEERFGRRPSGLWPSEGSVSDAALELVAASGLTWAATDEEILRRSLGDGAYPLAKYFPWSLRTSAGPLWMLFRDHMLSDAIGFVYSSWGPADAAADFFHRLVEIRNRIIQELGPDALAEAIVPVILDGENCWEYYESNGRPFLESLYELLSESNEVAATTISEELAKRTPRPERSLGRIFSGSWIGANFRIWIGHHEDNAAWDAVAAARSALLAARGRLDDARYAEAFEEIYIAEGSDWYWWFGDENTAVNQDDFDRLFRYHLRRVYELIGEPVPAELDVPIRIAVSRPAVSPPIGPITPAIDGQRSEEEWQGAGSFVVERIGGTMHRADVFERRVYFGADQESLFLRYDTTMPLGANESIRIRVHAARQIVLQFTATSLAIESTAGPDGIVRIGGVSAAIGDTLEAAIPLRLLSDGPVESFGLVCEISEDGRVTDRFPLQGVVECTLAPIAAGAPSVAASVESATTESAHS
jgi:alpha-amylase/alpha-mannosidase (GH57 family)